MATDDPESDKKVDPAVREVIADQQRIARPAQQDAAATEKKRKRLARKALQAIRARDERAFAKHLREAGVHDGSDEWNRAWKIFREGGAEF
jgi:hypothetical protein